MSVLDPGGKSEARVERGSDLDTTPQIFPLTQSQFQFLSSSLSGISQNFPDFDTRSLLLFVPAPAGGAVQHVRGVHGLPRQGERPPDRRHLHDPTEHGHQPRGELAVHGGSVVGGSSDFQGVPGRRRPELRLSRGSSGELRRWQWRRRRGGPPRHAVSQLNPTLLLLPCLQVCVSKGGACVTTLDGYYVESVVCVVIGLVWWVWLGKKMRRLQEESPAAWKCRG